MMKSTKYYRNKEIYTTINQTFHSIIPRISQAILADSRGTTFVLSKKKSGLVIDDNFSSLLSNHQITTHATHLLRVVCRMPLRRRRKAELGVQLLGCVSHSIGHCEGTFHECIGGGAGFCAMVVAC